MENQQVVKPNIQSSLNQLKIMNKLGFSFFIMFILGAFLPLADLGPYVEETISLYYLTEPTLLIVLAFVAVAVFITGISRTAARAISLTFVVLVLWALLSQLYEIYDLVKESRELRGRDFEFKHFAKSLSNTIEGLPIDSKELVSVASILLLISFVGILACIFSPRYKENKTLKAALTGKALVAVESDASEEENNTKTKQLIADLAAKTLVLLRRVFSKIVDVAKLVYQVVSPLISSFLDKGADIICEKQPQLKKENVKLVLGCLLALLVLWIIF